jgi:hypothetical protein
MRAAPIRPNLSNQHVELEQIKELSRRMDELLKRTRRGNRNFEDRLQQALDCLPTIALSASFADE